MRVSMGGVFFFVALLVASVTADSSSSSSSSASSEDAEYEQSLYCDARRCVDPQGRPLADGTMVRADVCDSFCLCFPERAVRFDCPASLHFDPGSGRCDFPQLARCELQFLSEGAMRLYEQFNPGRLQQLNLTAEAWRHLWSPGNSSFPTPASVNKSFDDFQTETMALVNGSDPIAQWVMKNFTDVVQENSDQSELEETDDDLKVSTPENYATPNPSITTTTPTLEFENYNNEANTESWVVSPELEPISQIENVEIQKIEILNNPTVYQIELVSTQPEDYSSSSAPSVDESALTTPESSALSEDAVVVVTTEPTLERAQEELESSTPEISIVQQPEQVELDNGPQLTMSTTTPAVVDSVGDLNDGEETVSVSTQQEVEVSTVGVPDTSAISTSSSVEEVLPEIDAVVRSGEDGIVADVDQIETAPTTEEISKEALSAEITSTSLAPNLNSTTKFDVEIEVTEKYFDSAQVEEDTEPGPQKELKVETTSETATQSEEPLYEFESEAQTESEEAREPEIDFSKEEFIEVNPLEQEPEHHETTVEQKPMFSKEETEQPDIEHSPEMFGPPSAEAEWSTKKVAETGSAEAVTEADNKAPTQPKNTEAADLLLRLRTALQSVYEGASRPAVGLRTNRQHATFKQRVRLLRPVQLQREERSQERSGRDGRKTRLRLNAALQRRQWRQ